MRFLHAGMMMSAPARLAHNAQLSEAHIVNALEGKLCRCTGCMNSSGDITRCVVPSRHAVLSFNTTSPAALIGMRSLASTGWQLSASDFSKGENKDVEGKRILEPIKGHLADTPREMHEDLESSISCAGGRVLQDLNQVSYVVLGGENAGEHLFM